MVASRGFTWARELAVHGFIERCIKELYAKAGHVDMDAWQNIRLDAKRTNKAERKAAESIYRSIGLPERGT